MSRMGRNPGRVISRLWVRYAGLAILIGVVVLLASMQFRWLTQLRQEEEQRRRVALRVAATSYDEHVSRELASLLDGVDASASIGDLAGQHPLLDAIFRLDDNGAARLEAGGGSGWFPAGIAELQQVLGRPLIGSLSAGKPDSRAALWLSPPSIVYCNAVCEVAAIPSKQLVDRVLAPGARRMFAEFGDELQLAVVVAGTRAGRVLYPTDGRVAEFAITDLTRDLLQGIPVLGPPGAGWRLLVNHSGRSLESAVARSHTRNLLLSASLLTLLLLVIGMVLLNARRQAALAREHLYFAAGVSHELRTPLTVISSAASNLADGTIDDQETLREHGALIQQQVQRLKRMIENVLQFTQSASAVRPRDRRIIAPRRLVESAIANCEPLLSERRLKLRAAENLPQILGDPAALESALGNLIANAARYAAGDDWIDIRVAAVRVRPRGRALRISISNPVEGRPDPQLHRLFEPFYRGQNVRNVGIPGTGIGLAVARSVAQQHGGGLTLDTARAGVVTFHLLLPIDEEPDTTHTAG